MKELQSGSFIFGVCVCGARGGGGGGLKFQLVFILTPSSPTNQEGQTGLFVYQCNRFTAALDLIHRELHIFKSI